jgi:hypothetical protein
MINNKKRRSAFSEKLDKKQQSLVEAINYHLSTDEHLKGCEVVNIISAKHTVATKTIKIGFTTIEGKYGTVLEKLKKSNRALSDYLFSLDIFFRPPKIEWFVEKPDDSIDRVKQLLEDIEKEAKEREAKEEKMEVIKEK